MHSAAPANQPALCPHSTVCNTHTGTQPKKCYQNLMLHVHHFVIVDNQTPTCTSWGGTSCLESCAGLWTGWRCGEPSLFSAVSLRESIKHQGGMLSWCQSWHKRQQSQDVFLTPCCNIYADKMKSNTSPEPSSCWWCVCEWVQWRF